MKNFTTAARVFFILISLLASMAFAVSEEQTGPVQPEGDWKGTIDAGGTKLDLVLHITGKDGALGATLDSPDQGADWTVDRLDHNNRKVIAIRDEIVGRELRRCI